MNLPVPQNVKQVANDQPRPFWSVMIPAYNPRADYLEETLRSILQQDSGAEQMQIEVVDDCSPKVNVEDLVKSIGKGRIAYSRTPQNLGLAGCWNTCIERARGEWVHILHQDDYVLPGFYQKLKLAAQEHPEVGLLATRSFFINEENIILGITPRLCELENGSRKVDDFFYCTPIQCPGVAVKRSAYEVNGGFRMDLTYTLDCEMWARLISSIGGLVTTAILACYRASDFNESSRLNKTAENLRDLERLSQLFAQSFPDFSPRIARERVCGMALSQALHFYRSGDLAASKMHSGFWRQNATAKLWYRRLTHKLERMMFK